MATNSNYLSEYDNSLKIYFSEIRKYKVLTQSEEMILLKKIREENDKKSLDKLVNSNLRFVVTIAKQYQNRGVSLKDLISDGNEGLITAVYAFDLSKNCKFITYAVWHIKQKILSNIGKTGKTVKQPISLQSKISLINKFKDNFIKENGREPYYGEVIDKESGCIYEDGFDYLNVASLNTKITYIKHVDNDEHEFIDILEDESSKNSEVKIFETILDQEELDITDYLKKLTKQEQVILDSYFGLSDSNEENENLKIISEKYGLTIERIRQIKNKAIYKLRDFLLSEKENIINE